MTQAIDDQLKSADNLISPLRSDDGDSLRKLVSNDIEIKKRQEEKPENIARQARKRIDIINKTRTPKPESLQKALEQ